MAQHFARPVTTDPRQPELSKRAWERSVRQWRMDLKAFVADDLAAAGFAGVGRVDESLRVPWRSEPGQPMYVAVQVSLDEVAFISVLDEPLYVSWPSERAWRRSRSPVGTNDECNEEV